MANSADAQGEDALMFESFEIRKAEPVVNCNQYAHDADCTVSTTAAALRKTPAGQKLQGMLDELRADAAHPSDAHVVLKPANQRTIDKVQELCGRDICQHKHSISPSELHHSLRGHPVMTDEDMMLMLDMHDNWDELIFEVRHNTPKLLYSKTYDGKKYIMVERIGHTPRTKTKTRHLHFTTEYQVNQGKKKERGYGFSPYAGCRSAPSLANDSTTPPPKSQPQKYKRR